MPDRLDAVPEADFQEQHTAVLPDDESAGTQAGPEQDPVPDRTVEPEAEPTPPPADKIGWVGSEGDLVDQGIEVPLADDEYQQE